ncbi:thioredoxin family protein [Nocardia sp. CDC159]|uniref:Thioredoxin family protein n=1 Tax=Nocardia pulmonis TaxID=2951408 RepID=A0A9X2E317_9NOCA|nr:MULTISPECIES: thioredoxin family protein [Nocardia]MCM6772984.1 thioredoxin family protein [Nocardia pulmonis]MCM6785713.1 thioredoxin family protein [Nocardia sp. CDC159]
MMQITILVVVLLAGVAAGLAIRLREGRIRTSRGRAMIGDDTRTELLAAVGVHGATPAVVHFSAQWCGPCAAVRRVVAGVVADLAQTPQPPQDIEVDIDAEPALAKELNVLSLPTTFVFDARGRERFRISGVPKAGDLRSALTPLTVPEAA